MASLRIAFHCGHRFGHSFGGLLPPLVLLLISSPLLTAAFRQDHKALDALRVQQELQSDEDLTAQLGLACRQFLDGLRQHLHEVVDPRVKQSLRDTAFVQGLEREGVSLEQQLQWFGLATLGLEQSHGEDPFGAHHHGKDLAFGASVESSTSASVLGSTWRDRLREIVERTKGRTNERELAAHEAGLTALMFLAKPVLKTHGPLSLVNPTAYRRSLLEHTQHEYDKWEAFLSKTMSPHFPLRNLAHLTEDERLTRMNNLFDSLGKTSEMFGQVLLKIRSSLEVDWQTVSRVKVSRWKRILRWSKKMVVNGVNNFKVLAERVFQAFLHTATKAEEQCELEHQANERAQMQKAGMKSGAKMVDILDRKDDQGVEAVLSHEIEKANKVVSAITKEGEGRKKQLAEEVEAMKQAGHIMEKESTAGTLNISSMEKLDKSMNMIQKTSCRVKEWTLVDQLRSILQQVKGLANDASPTLGVRGVGGMVSVRGGGTEEVIDFWNKEIGIFSWDATEIGLDSLVKVFGGAYVGVGWKGYKLDWNLQDACQSMTLMGITPEIEVPVPLVAPSIGGSLALDVDISGLPAVFDSLGLSRLSVGWSLTLGLHVGLLSLLNAGRSLTYSLHTSECFSRLKDFLIAIWLPYCKSCKKGREQITMSARRAAIRIAAFPILSDLIFSVLAVRADSIRREQKGRMCPVENRTTHLPCLRGGYNPDLDEELRCSQRSTRYRNDERRFARRLTSQMLRLSQQLQAIEKEGHAVLQSMETAMGTNPDVLASPEASSWVNKMVKAGIFCPRAPPEETLSFALDAPLRQWPEELRLAALKTKGRKELEDMCRRRSSCKRHLGLLKTSKQTLIKNLRLASEEYPYGACSTDSDCGNNARMSCECSASKGLWAYAKKKCPGASGRCRCQKGSCWTRAGGCAEEKVTPETLGIKRMSWQLRTWVWLRGLELGSHAVRFQETVNQQQ